MTVIQSLSDLGLTVVALVTTLLLARVSWVYFEQRLGKRAHQYSYDTFDRRPRLPVNDLTTD